MERAGKNEVGTLDDEIRKIVAAIVPAVTSEVVPAVVAAIERRLIEVRKDIVRMRERLIDEREHRDRRFTQIEVRIDGLERAIENLDVPRRVENLVGEEMLEAVQRRSGRTPAH